MLGASACVLSGLLPFSAAIALSPTPNMAHWLDDLEEIDVAPLPKMKGPSRQRPSPQGDNRPKIGRYVTLKVGGDLGFGGSRQPVVANAGMRQGRRYSYSDLTRHLRPYLKSDLVFANLETVVTSTNGLSTFDKKFNFRMHPDGVKHLVKTGFNLLSTANNHAIDYGATGMRHTLRYLAPLKSKGLVAAHGVGATLEDVVTPATFTRKGASFAFSALGIGGMAPTKNSPGQLHYRSARADVAIETLGKTEADFRMLSVHYGAELQVRPSRNDRTRFQSAIVDSGVDLVIGHHAHTPAGIERIGDRLVFYGLGNLLHLGMQSMDRLGVCRDFGVLARLHLVSGLGSDDRLTAKAVEIYTLSRMNMGARVREGANGRRRIEVLNYLGAELDEGRPARAGVRFATREDGSGLYCAPGASKLGGAVGALCAAWKGPTKLSAATTRSLKGACRYRRKSSPVAKAKQPKLRGTQTASAKQRRRHRLMTQAFRSEN